MDGRPSRTSTAPKATGVPTILDKRQEKKEKARVKKKYKMWHDIANHEPHGPRGVGKGGVGE